jgi:PAS domain S-box-containing protein
LEPSSVDLVQLLDGFGEAVICTDGSGTIVGSNPAAARLLGRPTLLGLPIGSVSPALTRVEAAGTNRLEVDLLRADGSRCRAIATASPAGAATAWTLRPGDRDVDGRLRLHQLARVDSLFAEPRPIDEALRRALELAVQALGDWAVLLRLAPPRGLEVLDLHHRDPARIPDLRRLVADGPAGLPGPELLAAIQNGRPTRFARAGNAAGEAATIGACLTVPLRTPGGVQGALVLGAREHGALVEEDLQFAQQLADRIAAGLVREELLARLAAERRRFGQVLDGLPEGVVLRDEDGELFANAAARELLGTAAPGTWPFEGKLSALDGTPVAFDRSPLRLAAMEGRTTLGTEYLLRRPGGDEATLLVNASPTHGPRPAEGPGGAVAVFQDVSLRKERLHLESLLSDVGRVLLDYSGPDETEPLRRMAATVAEELGGWCAFSLVRADGSAERIGVGFPDPDFAAAEGRLGELLAPRTWGRGQTFDLLRAGEPVILDLTLDGRAGARPLAVILAPLRSEAAPQGVFLLARLGGRPFGENEMQFARGLAARATLAVRNARLTRALQRERDLLLASRDDARAANGTLQAIVRHAPVGIGHVDRELRFVLVNEVLASLSGRPPAEHVGRRADETLGGVLPGAVADIRHVLERGRPAIRREVELEGAGDNRVLDLACYPVRDERDRVLGATLIVVDQTAQVRARRRIAELAAEEHRRAAELTSVLDADPNAIALFGADGRLRYASPRLGELLRMPPAEAIGRHYREVFEGCRRELHDPAGILVRAQEYFADRTRTFTEELELEVPERRIFRTTTAPVIGHGAYLGRIFVFVDVTRDRELDRQRSDFLSVASHELKTPLTPLSLGLQGLERRLARGQPVDAAMVQKSRRQVVRLTALIDYLLDLSRLESGRLELGRESFSLAELAEEVVDEFRGATQIHDMLCVVPAEPVIVEGDRGRLEQVLVNLIQNAIKYSPRGGEVRVAVERVGDEAMVSVGDQGIGIPAEEQARLFERFFRARNAGPRNFGGLGIGLFVSHEIVARHGGRFEVESVPGRGSTFRFRVPLRAQAREMRPAAAARAAAALR